MVISNEKVLKLLESHIYNRHWVAVMSPHTTLKITSETKMPGGFSTLFLKLWVEGLTFSFHGQIQGRALLDIDKTSVVCTYVWLSMHRCG